MEERSFTLTAAVLSKLIVAIFWYNAMLVLIGGLPLLKAIRLQLL
jgi:hypothetical protein